jgi:RNA polymerase sigma factor (sigma-70 family)
MIAAGLMAMSGSGRLPDRRRNVRHVGRRLPSKRHRRSRQPGPTSAVMARAIAARPTSTTRFRKRCRSGIDADGDVIFGLVVLRSLGVADVPAEDVDARLAHLATEDLRIDLGRAIRSLPDHYREVILLRDIEELSIDEIAGVLDLTRESVKARIHRARMLIREYLIRD